MKLYFAYGANTNAASTKIRCPDIRFAGTGTLKGWQLEFKGVADIVRAPGEILHGVLAFISDEDEYALDRFEGFPRFYVKRYVKVRSVEGWTATAMVYVMRERHSLGMPSRYYEEVLRKGYADFGLPSRQLDEALERANKSRINYVSSLWGSADDTPTADWSEYEDYLAHNA